MPCDDCEKLISKRAEFCIHCGRFIQSLRLSEVIGRNWSLRIAGGIILAFLITAAMVLFLWVVFFTFLFGGQAVSK